MITIDTTYVSQNRTILLVDDDIDLLENTSFMIKSMGYEIITAQDGEEAVKSYKEANPGLTIMDMKMPKMDGYEAFNKIKQHDNDAKVVLISAYYIDEEKHQKAKSMGLLTTISKPYTFEILEEIIKKYT